MSQSTFINFSASAKPHPSIQEVESKKLSYKIEKLYSNGAHLFFVIIGFNCC